MRHRSKTAKLKRNASHRKALLSNLACSLIEHGRIKTTLGKAKALRPVAEKLVTLAKRDDLHSRRLAIAFLHQKDTVKKLFSEDDILKLWEAMRCHSNSSSATGSTTSAALSGASAYTNLRALATQKSQRRSGPRERRR